MTQELKPFCNKCGDDLPHDEDFCKNNPYPALAVEHRQAIQTAHRWNIDLTKANEKQAGGGRFGAIEGDLMLDLSALIDNFERKETHLMTVEQMQKLGLSGYITNCLENFGYDFKTEISKALDIIRASTEDDRRSRAFWFKEVYTFPVVKYEIENHIEEAKEMLKDPDHKGLLDFWYNCNAFKLQLQEIYKRRSKEGTLNPELELKIKVQAQNLTDLEKEIDKIA